MDHPNKPTKVSDRFPTGTWVRIKASAYINFVLPELSGQLGRVWQHTDVMNAVRVRFPESKFITHQIDGVWIGVDNVELAE